MSALTAKRIEILEGDSVIFVARVETAGGVPVTTAMVSSFSIAVFDLDSDADVTDPVRLFGSLAPEIGYYDDLQYDEAMNLLGDSGGYNFKYVLDPLDDFAFQGSRKYRVQIVSQIGGASHTQLYDVVTGEVL